MSKYNWEKLENDYILGNYDSVSDFLNSRHIPRNGNTNKKTANWNNKKVEKEQKKSKKIQEKVIEKESSIEANNRVKINDVANDLLQKISIQSSDDTKNIKSLTSALRDLKEVITEEKVEADKPYVYLPAKDIGKSFVDIYRDIKERKHDDYWLEGGRGSIKSSFWSQIVPEELENHPNWCAICIRKVANTLKDSVYSQLEWGMDKMSETFPFINENWKKTTSPLEMKNKNTGQMIYFRGADDPGKIKSIKPPKGMYIALIIYEEFDQMSGMNEVRKIDQSVKRGGNEFLTFRIYNTPRSKRHFVNVEKRAPNPKRLVHRSTYLDVPIDWLGKPFFDDAEILKENNPIVYANEYLGEETGDGGNVFENIELREITDEEIENFDYLYQGMDFGWFPDPLAWTKMCYQPNKLTLYIFDEFVVNKMSNADVWDYLQEEKKVKNDDLITADSEDMKSIGDFQSYGSLMRGTKKGPGTVDYSMKWLARLAKIVIDPKRCPRSAEEFTTYEHPQDKDGNYISGYVDADNHCIDSVRYAMNPVWRRKGE
ncbi:MAG: phage terminase large subunit [Bacilli bacterium]|nr:phage terminase large subunit [Bacilli bacterium]